MVRHAVMKQVAWNRSGQKLGMETVVAGFADLLAVFLRIKLEARLLQRDRGLWK